MNARPAPFDSHAPLGSRRAIIRRNPEDSGEIEMVEAAWGSNPQFSDGVSFRFVRSENQSFPANRCLIPASEFRIRAGDKDYRVTLDSGNFFYLAGVCEAAMGDHPLSFRIITVPANREVARYQERHGAIIHRPQVMDWLDARLPEYRLLDTPPAHSFLVEEIKRQAAFAL